MNTVASLGVSKTRKSSTFNYLLTGNSKYPFPTSATKPIRCVHAEIEGVKLYSLVADEYQSFIELWRFSDLYTNMINTLLELVTTEEVLIEFSFYNKLMRNFAFLDTCADVHCNARALRRSRLRHVFVFDQILTDQFVFFIKECCQSRPFPGLVLATKIWPEDFSSYKSANQKLVNYNTWGYNKMLLQLDSQLCRLRIKTRGLYALCVLEKRETLPDFEGYPSFLTRQWYNVNLACSESYFSSILKQ